jgi:hypothetical protein
MSAAKKVKYDEMSRADKLRHTRAVKAYDATAEYVRSPKKPKTKKNLNVPKEGITSFLAYINDARLLAKEE